VELGLRGLLLVSDPIRNAVCDEVRVPFEKTTFDRVPGDATGDECPLAGNAHFRCAGNLALVEVVHEAERLAILRSESEVAPDRAPGGVDRIARAGAEASRSSTCR